MTRSIADLSWDEIDDLAQEAAEDAIDRAHDAGIATFGIIEGHYISCSPQRILKTAVSFMPRTTIPPGLQSGRRFMEAKAEVAQPAFDAITLRRVTGKLGDRESSEAEFSALFGNINKSIA